MLRFAVLLLVLPATLFAQSIAITSVPAYGTAGNITGVVSGVNTNNHYVAVYIHIEGSGWWTKPSSTSPAVPILPNGTFSASVVTGGIDDRATGFFVALVPGGGSIPIALGANNIIGLTSIATDFVERYSREIQFAGRTWGVKEAPIPVGPGGNYFASGTNDVFVDASGRLHLRVRHSNGQWRASEVILKESLGYGTYWFTTESEVEDLDRNVTLGAFTWDIFGDDFTIPAWPNREIDFEDSRWGNPGDPTTSQVVVQPYNVGGNLIRYTTPDLSSDPELTRFFRWSPTTVDFMAARGRHTPCTVPPSQVVHQSTYQHNPAVNHRVPPAGRERMRFNLWVNSGGGPSNGQLAEVIISDFRFSDSANLFTGGSRINIPDTLSVLSGTPAIGTTVTLGLDDPNGIVTPGAPTFLMLSAFRSAGFPAGSIISGIGFGGADIELQLAPTPDPLILPGFNWSGPGSPVPYAIPIPAIPALVGLPLYFQGVLYDVTPAIALTDALEMCFSL